MKNNKPLVSIGCITYNHEKFIAQTLDGFLSQKTDFPFEILIHDDASTDKTANIIREYEKKHPGIIKPIYQKENQFSQGKNVTFTFNLPRAKGKYLALCEGDDYWTDPHKLQQQVDFLEAHEDYALCFHPVRVKFEGGEEKDAVYPDLPDDFKYTVEALLGSNFIQTNSVVYRRQDYSKLKKSGVMPGDWYFHLYHAQFGKIGFINKVMSVYRRHAGGIWWGTHKNRDDIWKKYGLDHVALYFELLKMYGDNDAHREIVERHIDGSIQEMVRIDTESNTTLLKNCFERFPEQYDEFAARIASLIMGYKKAVDDTRSELEGVHKQLDAANSELSSIKSSKTYMYAKKAAQIKSKLIK